MTTFVALLRAVNVGGRKVEMAPLRQVAEKAGFQDVRTYIASGNLLVSGSGTAAAVQAKLEEAIAARFGIEVPVIVRTAGQWTAYLTPPKPFAAAEPNRLLLGLGNGPMPKEAAKAIEARGVAGEKVLVAGDALWFHYPGGQGASKITPSFVDKAAGMSVTARNLNTVRKLAEMAAVTG